MPRSMAVVYILCAVLRGICVSQDTHIVCDTVWHTIVCDMCAIAI